jgi:hypothetical protein
LELTEKKAELKIKTIHIRDSAELIKSESRGVRINGI